MGTEISELGDLLLGGDPKSNEVDPVDNEEVLGEEYLEEEDTEELEDDDNEIDNDEDEDDPSPDDDHEEISDDDDDYYPETLQELIEAYDGNEERLKNIVISAKQNGENVTLKQVIQHWETGEAVNRKSQEFSEKLKSLDVDRQKFHSAIEGKLEEQAAVLEALEDLYKNAGKAELEELREYNPAEYAARKADIDARDRTLDSVKAAINERKEKAQHEKAEEFKTKYASWQQEQYEKMFNLIPDWKDEKVFNQDVADIAAYAAASGFTDKEFSNMQDARVRKIMRDAMLYNRGKTIADPKKKRILKKPKKVVRGGNRNKDTAKDSAYNKRMKAAANSNDRRDKTAAIAELLLTE